METVQTKLREDFKVLVNQLANKDLTKNQFINRSRWFSRTIQAYRLGTDASGLNFLDCLMKICDGYRGYVLMKQILR